MSRTAWIASLLLLAALVTLRLLYVQPDEVHVHVDTSVRHQTIEGFGARIFESERVGDQTIETIVPPEIQLEEVILRAARELRLNHLAVGIPRRFEVVNDDADPFTFTATADDERVVRELAADHLAAFQNAVANEGGSFWFEVHERRGDQPAWWNACPPEAREHLGAFLARLGERFREPPRRWLVLGAYPLEPGQTADPSLPDLGGVAVLRPDWRGPSNPRTIEGLLDELERGATSWNALKLYQMGLHPETGAWFTAPTEGGFVTEGPSYWELRQVTFHVPAGAARIGCSNDDGRMRTLAFEHEGRTIVTVANLARPRRSKKVHLHGLRSGPYTVSVVENGRPPVERGLHEVSATGDLTLEVPGRSVVAIAMHPGPNQRPTITRCESRPAMPLWDERIELMGLAADPENAALTYHWEVLEHPEAAELSFHSPDARATRVTGLKPTGRYRFRFTVRDEQGLRDERDLVVEHPAGPALSFPGSLRRAPVPPTHWDGTLVPPLVATLHKWPYLAGWLRWTILEAPEGAQMDLEEPWSWLCPVRASRPVPGRYRIRRRVSCGWVGDDDSRAPAPATDVTYPLFVWPASSEEQEERANWFLPETHAFPLTLAGQVRERPGETGSWDLVVQSNVPDDLPAVYHWTLEERPEGSRARIDWQVGSPQRLVDATQPGLYRLRLAALAEWWLGSAMIELRIPGEDGR